MSRNRSRESSPTSCRLQRQTQTTCFGRSFYLPRRLLCVFVALVLIYFYTRFTFNSFEFEKSLVVNQYGGRRVRVVASASSSPPPDLKELSNLSLSLLGIPSSSRVKMLVGPRKSTPPQKKSSLKLQPHPQDEKGSRTSPAIKKKALTKRTKNTEPPKPTKQDLLVNTTFCQIPTFEPFDKDVQPFLQPPRATVDCAKHQHNWTHMSDNRLFIHKAQMKRDGVSFSKGFCCYRVIKRGMLTKEEELQNNHQADNLVKFSNCTSITKEKTLINHEFIVVECGLNKKARSNDSKSDDNERSGPTHRDFYATALAENSESSKNVKKKIKFWQAAVDVKRRPPNVLILGFDATSRLNFRRKIIKTKKILEELGAVEMMGFMKVGENTFPNMIAALNGYNEDDLRKICYPTRWSKQDNCPNIWNRFDAANYITAHSEDGPSNAIFNYMKTAFVQQPVDFYLRPLYLAAHNFGDSPLVKNKSYKVNTSCVGSKTNEEMVLSYVESVLDLGFRNGIPVYSVSWSTQTTHDSMNNLQLLDKPYADFLQRIDKKGYLDNTILIIMGDHGFRFGSFPHTRMGYYEGKLPLMWIRIPPWLERRSPEIRAAMEVNSRRLTSPFNLYWTLNWILQEFFPIGPPPNSKDSKTNEIIGRKHKNNFFEVVPENSKCSDVGVPFEYCGCGILQPASTDDPLVKKAVSAALKKVNEELAGTKCAPLKVSQILKASVQERITDGVDKFTVSFTTDPGQFVFEGVLQYFLKNSSFTDKPSVIRTSRINQDHIDCVNDPQLQNFCFCL